MAKELLFTVPIPCRYHVYVCPRVLQTTQMTFLKTSADKLCSQPKSHLTAITTKYRLLVSIILGTMFPHLYVCIIVLCVFHVLHYQTVEYPSSPPPLFAFSWTLCVCLALVVVYVVSSARSFVFVEYFYYPRHRCEGVGEPTCTIFYC